LKIILIPALVFHSIFVASQSLHLLNIWHQLLLHKIPNVQVSDTTGDAPSSVACK